MAAFSFGAFRSHRMLSVLILAVAACFPATTLLRCFSGDVEGCLWGTISRNEIESISSAPAGVSSRNESSESWDVGYDATLEFRSRCNIPRVDASALTPSQFEAEYLEKKPVIIRGAVNNSQFASLVQRKRLLDAFGENLITLSSANRNSYAKREVQLRDYVTSYVSSPQQVNASGADSWYHFGDNKFSEWDVLFRQYKRLHRYTFSPHSSLSFGIGSSGSGVPFHTHGHVFNEVLHGRKRWWLAEPRHEPRFNGDESTLWWLHNVFPSYSEAERSQLHECTCTAGEALYVPGLWHHATLNLGQTVFMANFV